MSVIVGEWMSIDRFSVQHDEYGDLFVDKLSGLNFRLVNGGQFECGLSDAELQLLEGFKRELDRETVESLALHKVELSSFLISESPIQRALLKDAVALLDDEEPPMVSYADAAAFCDKFSLDLPTYWELEIAFRGSGARELFPFGNTLMDEEAMEEWMSSDWSASESLRRNSTGLVGILWGGWSKTPYGEICRGTDTVDVAVKLPVAGLWPWQDEEWIFCLNAMHVPSSMLPMEDMCVVRPVYRLE